MGKYVGPARIRLHGNRDEAVLHIGRARNLLGGIIAMHSDSHRIDYRKRIDKDNPVNAIYQLKGENFCARTIRTPEGVYITVRNNDIIPIIDIVAPYKVGAEKALEHRGLLRALQDEADYCEPVVPPEGEPGDEGYNPGEFSELHPLYDPEDSDQQWLVYPDSLSIEHNPFKNYPLPPLGGTFIMDMLGAPFNPRAFSIDGKPNLFSCKMLLTGGGSREGDGEFQVGEVIEGIRVRELEPRVFRVGRMNEMNGWPWADKRDPEQSFLRLVSLSARLEHTSGSVGQNYNKAIFTLEFLKLNNTECVQAEEETYVCLDPVEFEVELDDALYDYAVHPFGNTEWVDFSILSLMPDGSKAVIGLHQRGDTGLLGQYYDFVILDLARIIDDPLDFDFYSRFDTWQGFAVRSFTNGDPLTNIPYVYEGPLTGDQFRRSEEVYDTITPKGDNYTVWNRQRAQYATAEQLGDNVFPASRTLITEYDFDVCIYMHFGNNGALHETYVRAEQNIQTTDTQSITHTDFDENNVFDGIPYVRTNWWVNDKFYPRGSIVSRSEFLAGITFTNVYITLTNHTSTTSNRPNLEWTGSEFVDRSGSAWKMVFGDRRDGNGCRFAYWNGVNDCYDDVPDTCAAYDAISHTGTFNSTGRLWLGEGGDEPVLIWYTYNPTFYKFDVTVSVHTASTIIRTTSIYQRKLDLEAEDVFARDFAIEDLVLQVISDATSARTEEEKTVFTKLCTVLAPTGYRAEKRTRSKTKETHFFSDTASSDGLLHDGVDYDLLPFPTSWTGGIGGGLPAGLLGNHVEGNYKALPFAGSRFGVIQAFPASGGWAVAIGARSGSTTSTNPTTTSNTSTNGFQKNKCVVTVGSKWAFTEVDDTNPWKSFSIIAGLQPDLEEMPAFTDPLPLVNMQAEEEEEAEALLKPVRGPEKSITCLEQQISYVGWLYPQELTEAEE